MASDVSEAEIETVWLDILVHSTRDTITRRAIKPALENFLTARAAAPLEAGEPSEAEVEAAAKIIDRNAFEGELQSSYWHSRRDNARDRGRKVLAARRIQPDRDGVLEEAATKATSFLIGNPFGDIPLRSPSPQEIADALRAMKDHK